MRMEYIFLVILTILPLLYKIWYWQYIFYKHKNKVQTFRIYLLSKQGRESCFHFWTLVEFPILLAWILPLIDSNFEYLWYPMFFYFMLIYNIYVLWKLLRKKIYLPIKDIFLVQILWVIWVWFLIPIIFPVSIYLYITSVLLCIPFFIIISYWILHILKKQ